MITIDWKDALVFGGLGVLIGVSLMLGAIVTLWEWILSVVRR